MVPKGWKVVDIEKCLKDSKSLAYGILQPGANIENGVPMIRTVDIGNNGLSGTNIINVSKELHQEYKRTALEGGEVLLSIMGTVGRTMVVPQSCKGWNVNRALAVIRLNELVDASYFSEYLKSPFINDRLVEQAIGSAQKRINLGDLRKYQLNIPPLPEQQKIAKILSTWDNAISTTERLIENSTQQKSALMQQLLTGKKRLLDEPGKRFEKKWEEVELGEISHITTGSSNREDSSLTGEYAFFDRSIDVRTSGIFLFDAEAIIVGGEGQDFVPKYFEGKFDLHQRTYAIMDFKNAYGKFLFYYIGYYRHYFLSQAVGSTVKSLRLPMFQKMPIKLPSVKEQQKIATVLTNADKEIELLEQQLADLQQEKKALMQVLLTGKKRVVIDGAVAGS